MFNNEAISSFEIFSNAFAMALYDEVFLIALSDASFPYRRERVAKNHP